MNKINMSSGIVFRGSRFLLAISLLLLASCAIPYDEAVIPAFKKNHPSARVTQIYPVGGLVESLLGNIDVAINYTENGASGQEIWTVTRSGGWAASFKCKSSGNVCI